MIIFPKERSAANIVEGIYLFIPWQLFHDPIATYFLKCLVGLLSAKSISDHIATAAKHLKENYTVYPSMDNA